MTWSVFILGLGFGICFVSCLWQTLGLIRTRPKDPQEGDRRRIRRSISYSFIGAMSPFKKESANRHWISYTMGIVFHAGSFLALFWLLIRLFSIHPPLFVVSVSKGLLWLTGTCGAALLAKRAFSPSIRRFSNMDDTFSNLLVTGFHWVSAVTMDRPESWPFLQVYAGILFFFIPLTKLRHTIYFFSARIHLALFYGVRGLWPAKAGSPWSKTKP